MRIYIFFALIYIINNVSCQTADFTDSLISEEDEKPMLYRRQIKKGEKTKNEKKERKAKNDKNDKKARDVKNAKNAKNAKDATNDKKSKAKKKIKVAKGKNKNLNDEVSEFCIKSGLTPVDGTQNTAGACSSTLQGAIPSVERMVSTIITSPLNGAIIAPKTTFTIRVKTINMNLGFFDDPKTKYYLTPQTLDEKGIIQGHQHVVIQKIDPNSVIPLDPRKFDFFLGLDKTPDSKNELFAVVENGLDNGEYRVCTITGTISHQPVIMPVAQRGSQDDCIRIKVQ